MMPEWLPEFCTTDGEWADVLAALYVIFRRDIAGNAPRIDGSPVWWDGKIADGYEETFWHLITRVETVGGDRLFDPRRAERLTWCGAILCHCTDPAIKRWRYREETGQLTLYLWLEAGDYVIVLRERTVRNVGRVYFLITAYHVNGDQTRKKLQRRYEKKEP